MTRQILSFACEGARLMATLDLPDGDAPRTGLLIVSGGNEIRSGTWGSQAQIAAQLAAQGYGVFRYDRRGVGDSEGENQGFYHSAPDIEAAMAAFRAAVPGMARVVAYGNCDGASALMLAHGGGADGLVLSNPWTFEEQDAAPSVMALRAHYRKRLLSFSAVTRLLSGKVSIMGLVKSLLSAARPAPPPAPLVGKMAQGLAAQDGPVRILLAMADNTAQAFLGAWDARDPRIARCPGATHSFVEPEARIWLLDQILFTLREV
jgi:exosortase A-associated hydrolase 1